MRSLETKPDPGLVAAAGATTYVRELCALDILDPLTAAERRESAVKEEECLMWYEERSKHRNENVEELKAAEGESNFQFGESLRISWLSQQRADKELSGIFGC